MRSANSAASSIVLPIVAEIGGAFFGGVVMALVFGYAISLVLANANLGMGLLTAQAYAAIVGFGVGASSGAALAGRLFNQGGKLWPVMIVAVLAGVLNIVVMRIFLLGDPIVTLGISVLVMMLVTVVGYNLRRGL